MRVSGIYSKYSGDKWAPRAQKIVWEYVSSYWRLRNKIVNGADDQEERRVARLQLNQLIQETYASRPAVGRRQNLFTQLLRDILKRSTYYLEHWLRDLKKQRRWKKDGKIGWKRAKIQSDDTLQNNGGTQWRNKSTT